MAGGWWGREILEKKVVTTTQHIQSSALPPVEEYGPSQKLNQQCCISPSDETGVPWHGVCHMSGDM